MSRAFTFVNVETIGFGLYADEQITVSGDTGTKMLKHSGAGALGLAESGSPGIAVVLQFCWETVSRGKGGVGARRGQGRLARVEATE